MSEGAAAQETAAPIESGAQHVVFSRSEAVSLREALATARRPDIVIAFDDDLSFGPINPVDPTLRETFVGTVLGYEPWSLANETFWRQALAPHANRIVWLSRFSTLEFCNFLEWLERNGDQLFLLVDLTGVRLADDSVPLTTSTIRPAQFVEQRFWDRAAAVDPDTRDSWLALWARLKAENAPLRILDNGTLVSAPLEHFDPMLLAEVSADWRRAARVIGKVIGTTIEAQGCRQMGDLVLASRLSALVEAGNVEAQGERAYILDYYVCCRSEL